MSTPTYRGQVVKAHSGFFTVYTDHDKASYVCSAAGRLSKGAHKEDALAVGDRVTFELIRSEGYIEGRIVDVSPRVRVLARKDPIVGSSSQDIMQVIVANPDLVVFVFSVAQPDFHARLLDRYLVGAEAQKIPVVICANKVDIIGQDAASTLFSDYERIGYTVIYTSTTLHTGIEELRSVLHSRLSVLIGKSGVGKSSLLNALKPGLGREVGVVSKLLKKGKHTTVVPELVQLDELSWIADTPGLRAYAIWDVDAEELDAYYREIAPYVGQCTFSDCTHTHEPGCAVITAVKTGNISPSRYESYTRLRQELSRQPKW